MSVLVLAADDGLLHQLPLVNACLNSIATVLLIVGFVLIKKKHVTAHRNCMIAAFAVSAVFLIGYVYHKVFVAQGINRPFNREGLIKVAYLVMLLTHVVLAMTVPVFAIILIRLGLKQRLEAHRRIAKVAYPIWLYVSVTGVLIYLALYPFNPPLE